MSDHVVYKYWFDEDGERHSVICVEGLTEAQAKEITYLIRRSIQEDSVFKYAYTVPHLPAE